MKCSTLKYGSWAVVTGASDGIGKAFAIALAQSGFSLVLVARRHELLEQLAQDLISRFGIECNIVSADLATPNGVNLVIQQTQALDVGLLIAAAGYGTSGAFVDAPIDEELAMIDLNCRAVVALTHHFAKCFKQRGRGGIVLMSSIIAFQGTAQAANYAATKAFIQAFSEGLRIELKPYMWMCLQSHLGQFVAVLKNVPTCKWAWHKILMWWQKVRWLHWVNAPL